MIQLVLLLTSLAQPPAFAPSVATLNTEFVTAAECETYKESEANKANVAEIEKKLVERLGAGMYTLVNECIDTGKPT